MGELAQGVQNRELGIGGGEESQSQGDSTTDDWVTIVKLGIIKPPIRIWTQ